MNKIIKVLGLAGAITFTLLYSQIFLTAYLNGIRGLGYDVNMYINNYKEAHLELILMFIFVPAVMLFVYYYLKELKGDKIDTQK